MNSHDSRNERYWVKLAGSRFLRDDGVHVGERGRDTVTTASPIQEPRASVRRTRSMAREASPEQEFDGCSNPPNSSHALGGRWHTDAGVTDQNVCVHFF